MGCKKSLHCTTEKIAAPDPWTERNLAAGLIQQSCLPAKRKNYILKRGLWKERQHPKGDPTRPGALWPHFRYVLLRSSTVYSSWYTMDAMSTVEAPGLTGVEMEALDGPPGRGHDHLCICGHAARHPGHELSASAQERWKKCGEQRIVPRNFIARFGFPERAFFANGYVYPATGNIFFHN